MHPLKGLLPLLSALLLALPALGLEIPPIPAGPYAVGSTNMEIQEKLPAPIIDYLKGSNGWFSPLRYLTQVLRHPEAAFVLQAHMPGANEKDSVPVVCYVLYPTSKDNPRPSYTFPYTDTGDNVFPHMQGSADKPLFAGTGKRWPVILYSHGYNAHGLWELDRLKHLASQGYIVVSIFHGDGRFGFLENFDRRPVMVKQVLDRLLADPDFGPAIDEKHIGASGSSFGAYTILACMGGSDPSTGKSRFLDARIVAGFGLVPYPGGGMRSPFGDDYAGLKTMKRPFLALYGDKDTNVPPSMVIAAVDQCGGETTAVVLSGEQHLLGKKAWNDVPTWEVLFFDAWLKDDPKARALLAQDLQVSGGVEDRKTHHHPHRADSL